MVWTTVLTPDIIAPVSIRQPNASSKGGQGLERKNIWRKRDFLL
jgi:hypothetical protein